MRYRPAFTLIEILVVVAIVALLVVLAIAGYGGARQRVKMDYAADSLVSLVGQQQSGARGGKQAALPSGAAQAAYCYGVSFSTGMKPYVATVEAPYVPVGVNKADYCDMQKSVVRSYDQFENYRIVAIDKRGSSVDSLTIMFRPPEARISFGEDNPVFTNNPAVTITFSTADGKDMRSFSIDISSGLAQRVNTVTRVKIPLNIRKPALTMPDKTTILNANIKK